MKIYVKSWCGKLPFINYFKAMEKVIARSLDNLEEMSAIIAKNKIDIQFVKDSNKKIEDELKALLEKE